MVANFVFINENLFVSVDDLLVFLESSIVGDNLENKIISAINSLKLVKQQNAIKIHQKETNDL